MAYSIRMTDEERGIVNAYAKLQGLSVAETFKKAVFNEIEDHYDLSVSDSAYQDYLKDPVAYSHEDAWKEIMNDL